MRIYVTPRPGRRVRDPLNPASVLPAEGAYKNDNKAWRRLAKAGDCDISDRPASPAAAPPAPAAETVAPAKPKK